MRVVIVPWWLQMMCHREGLANRDLLNRDKLSLYVSHRDLSAYESMVFKLTDHMKALYGLDLPSAVNDRGTPLVYWSSPFEHRLEQEQDAHDQFHAHMVMDVKESMHSPEETMVDELFGRQLTREARPVFSFHCEDIPCDGDQDVLGLFPYILEDPTNKHQMDMVFVDRFLETLYAHQCPLTELARSDVMAHHLMQFSHAT